MLHTLKRSTSLKVMAGIAIVASAMGVALAQTAVASDFPAQPIKIVVPFAAGGPADLAGRAFGQYLAQKLGGSVVIDNRGGGGGVVAINSAAGAKPDGHTLLFAASGNITLQPLLSNPPMPIETMLLPVAQVTSSPHGLFVTSKLPVNNLEEFIAYAKANPGKLNFATPGVGGLGHLGVEYFKRAAGIDAQTVHYKGLAQSTQDLLSGQVHATLASTASMQGLVDQGGIKLLGLTGPTKAQNMNNVPLISKTVPGFEYTTWYGFFAPAGTPDAVIEKISAALRGVGDEGKLVGNLQAQGIDVVVTDPQALKQLARQDTAKWQKVISDANLSLK